MSQFYGFETRPRRAVIARRTIRCFKAGTSASHIRPIFGKYYGRPVTWP
jgi:hypothetical protein